MADQLTQQANQAVATVDAQNPYATAGTDPNAALFKSSLAGQGSSSAPVTMTPEMATGNAPIAIPKVTPPVDTSAGLVGGAAQTAKTLQDYIKEITPAPTEADQQQQAVLDRISSLTGQATGRQKAQIDAENASGATTARQKLNDINNELTIANANYEKQFANLGGNGVVETAGLLNAQQAGLRRAQAADVALIAARAQAAQGNLTIALDTANRAVDAKYADVEDQIKIAQAQLAAIAPRLDKEQRIQAEALNRQYEEQKQKTADEKAKAKENLNLALTAGIETKLVNKNGEFFQASDGKSFATPQELFAAYGVKSFEELYAKGLVTDYSPSKLEDRNFVAQLAAKYPDAGIKLSDDSETAQSKLGNSRIYKKETYIAPTGGGRGGGGIGGAGTGGLNDLDTIAGSLSTQLGSVAAMDTFKSQYAKAKTDEEKVKVLTQYARLPTEIKTGIIQNNQVTKSLTDIESSLAKGVQTGLLASGRSYVANKLGTGGDKEIESIKSRLVASLQPYRNKVTGAAWGDQEEAEYQALIGSVKFAPEDLSNKIATFKDILKQQSQTALLSAIDLSGAINNNSPVQGQQGFETTNRNPQGTTQLHDDQGNVYNIPNSEVDQAIKDGLKR